jgi:hypothetical protein
MTTGDYIAVQATQNGLPEPDSDTAKLLIAFL